MPGSIRADLIAWQQLGAMWEIPAEEVEHALQRATDLTGGSGDEASLSVLRTVRMALAQEHGYLLEAAQRARSGPLAGEHAPPARPRCRAG